MFDIVGKRRWYFLFSALITLPGLFFIFVAPLFSKDAGLQFTIDYTGGTKWEIRFENESVTADQVRAVFADERPGSLRPCHRRRLPRDQDRADRPPAASTVPDPGRRRSRLRRAPAAVPARPLRHRHRPRLQRPALRLRARVTSPSASPSPSPSPSPSASPSASASAGASPGTSPSPSPSAAVGNTELPTDGKLGEMVAALEDALGPIESAAVADYRRARRELGPDPAGTDPHRRRISRDHVLDHLSVPRREVRGDRARHRSFMTSSSSLALRAPRDVLPRPDRRLVRDRDADRHRVQRPRHDRRLRPDPREPGTSCRRAVRGGRQPLDPADLRPVDHDELHRSSSRSSPCSCSADRRSATSCSRCSSGSSPGPTPRSSTRPRSSSSGRSGTTDGTAGPPRPARRGRVAQSPDEP